MLYFHGPPYKQLRHWKGSSFQCQKMFIDVQWCSHVTWPGFNKHARAWPAVNIVKKSTSLSHYCKLLYLRNSDVQLGFLHSKSETLFFFKATCWKGLIVFESVPLRMWCPPSEYVFPMVWKASSRTIYIVSDRSCFFIAVDVDPMLTIVLAKLILERSPWPGPVICWNCVALLNSFMYSNWSYVFLLSVNSKSYWSLSFSMFVGLFVSFCLLCIVLVWSVLFHLSHAWMLFPRKNHKSCVSHSYNW